MKRQTKTFRFAVHFGLNYVKTPPFVIRKMFYSLCVFSLQVLWDTVTLLVHVNTSTVA